VNEGKFKFLYGKKKNVINKKDIGFSGKINDDNSFKFLWTFWINPLISMKFLYKQYGCFCKWKTSIFDRMH